MSKRKKVKITFHTLNQKMWKSENDAELEENPYWNVETVLNYKMSLPKTDRFYDLKDDKYCFVESMEKQVIDENCYLFGYFKSSRSEYRPDLIDKSTGDERPNPKKITEGDVERTHYVLKLSKTDNEVYLFLEYNHFGISIHNFVNYISESAKQYLQTLSKEKKFAIVHYEISRNDFPTELERLTRTVLAEVHFDKKLLGSDALDFSNRTIPLQKNLVLSARASKNESIKEFGVDIWNKMHQKNSPISKLRIKGRDENNNEILLDTDLMCQSDFIEVDKDPDTGDLNSGQIMAGMRRIATSF